MGRLGTADGCKMRSVSNVYIKASGDLHTEEDLLNDATSVCRSHLHPSGEHLLGFTKAEEQQHLAGIADQLNADLDDGIDGVCDKRQKLTGYTLMGTHFTYANWPMPREKRITIIIYTVWCSMSVF